MTDIREELKAMLTAASHAEPWPEAAAGVFFRQLYDRWVDQGGRTPRGQPRNSVQKIKLWLGQTHNVRSLEKKLAGSTRLGRADAKALVELFLKRWLYDQDKNDYIGFASGGSDPNIERLLDRLFNNNPIGIKLPSRKRAPHPNDRKRQRHRNAADVSHVSKTLDSGNEICRLFRKSDAIITVSHTQTIIGSEPHFAMKGFQELVDQLLSTDKEDNFERKLIWIIDIGRRTFEPKPLLALYNVMFLRAQFEAFAVMNSPDRTLRWQWLTERCAFLVASLLPAEIDICYRNVSPAVPSPDLHFPTVTADSVTLGVLPDDWHKTSLLSPLYGEELERLAQRTITIHPRLVNRQDALALSHENSDFEYLAHGPPSEHENVGTGRCIKLPVPDDGSVDAFRIAYAAAVFRLRPNQEEIFGFRTADSIAHLRHQGIAVLRLQEFLFRLPRAIERDISQIDDKQLALLGQDG